MAFWVGVYSSFEITKFEKLLGNYDFPNFLKNIHFLETIKIRKCLAHYDDCTIVRLEIIELFVCSTYNLFTEVGRLKFAESQRGLEKTGFGAALASIPLKMRVFAKTVALSLHHFLSAASGIDAETPGCWLPCTISSSHLLQLPARWRSERVAYKGHPRESSCFQAASLQRAAMKAQLLGSAAILPGFCQESAKTLLSFC